MRRILLIIVGLSVALFADFSRDDDTQIVTDSTTKLQWQDDTNVSTTSKSWEDALAYCEASTRGGHNDWRLPNIKELTSIVDDTRVTPSIDTGVFQHVAPYGHWSSTTYAGDSSRAWSFDFSYAYQYHNFLKNETFCARCVRAGQ